MKSRTFLSLVALILLAPRAQAGRIDKAKLGNLAELPKISVSFSISYSTTLGFYFNGNKPDPLVEIAQLQKQMKGDASDAERYLRLDWLYSKAGRTKESNAATAKVIALCRKQVREHPDDMRWLALLGEALIRSGELKEGETLLRRAVKEAPKEWRAWLALASYLDVLALRAILGVKYLSLHSLGDKILSSTLNEKKPTSEQIAKMRRLRDEARRSYARVIELAPREAEPYWRRIGSNWTFAAVEATLRARKGKKLNMLAVLATPECAADMSRIARLSPDDPNRVGAALLLTILAGMEQKKATASKGMSSIEEFLAGKQRSFVDKLPGESGKSARWSMERLEQLASTPDKATAVAASEFLANVLMLLKQVEEDSGSHSTGGMPGVPPAAAEDGYTARILKYLRRTVQLDPSRDRAWDLLMGLLSKSKNTRDALEVGRNRVKIKDNAHNRFWLAAIYAEDHQWAEAAKHLRVAVKNDAKDLDGRLALIAVLLRRDDPAARKEAGEQLDAVEPLVKEAKRKPRTVSYFVLRGIHAALSDRGKEAKESFEQALRLDKGEKNAARGLAALGEPLTPDDQQMANDYLLAIKGTIERADKRPDAAVTEVRLSDDDITDDDLFYLTAFPQLRKLSLSSKSITDAGLAYVEDRTTLQELALNFTKITDKGLARLKSLANLRSLNLENSRITAAGLAHLEAFQKLQQLSLPDLSGTSDKDKETAWEQALAQFSKLPNLREVSLPVSTVVTDKGMAHLSAIPCLEVLHLPYCKITEKGMSLLGRCAGLRTLSFSGEQLTDARLVHLKGLPHLRELSLHNTKITGAGLIHLKGLTELEVLDLSDSAITDAGLANLSGLTNLRELDLSKRLVPMDGFFEEALRAIDKSFGNSTPAKKPAKKPAKPQITDAGLKHLRSLTKLTKLHLFGRPITDSGLTQLAKLKSLRQLNVNSTKVTQQGVAQLRKAIPELEIFR